LRDAGITPDERWRMNLNSLDYEAGASAAAMLMAQRDAPSAIFAVSDTLAIGVIHGLRSVGKRVPDDIAVVGFDDISLAAQIDPPLTTIAQPMRELGETAARLLLAASGESPGKRAGRAVAAPARDSWECLSHESRRTLRRYPQRLRPGARAAWRELRTAPGRIYGLLGENGAGKSTLMKILAGYETATAGTLLIDGAAQQFDGSREAEAAASC
jgi:hypothetical protein